MLQEENLKLTINILCIIVIIIARPILDHLGFPISPACVMLARRTSSSASSSSCVYSVVVAIGCFPSITSVHQHQSSVNFIFTSFDADSS